MAEERTIYQTWISDDLTFDVQRVKDWDYGKSLWEIASRLAAEISKDLTGRLNNRTEIEFNWKTLTIGHDEDNNFYIAGNGVPGFLFPKEWFKEFKWTDHDCLSILWHDWQVYLIDKSFKMFNANLIY